MRDLPILFSGLMVRAILEGRKTVTRRPVKPQPELATDIWEPSASGSGKWIGIGSSPTGGTRQTWGWATCPYGQPGDRLWVRETWMPGYYHEADHEDGPRVSVIYRADNVEEMIAAPTYELAEQWERDFSEDGDEPPPWRPSIHMPRWASRISLEVTGVRVERLQDISREDALAEGITDMSAANHIMYGLPGDGIGAQHPVRAFQLLWESINGAGSWDANPYIWVIEFKRVEVARG